MALHHRREIPDMRLAFAKDRSNEPRSQFDSDSDRSTNAASNNSRSSGSRQSYQTQPTSYSSSPSQRQPYVRWSATEDRQKDFAPQFFDDRCMLESPSASPSSSVETYASTVDSEADLPEQPPDYQVPDYTARLTHNSTIPATSSEFSELFPSDIKLSIRHDDSTIDGNMNLRVDAGVSIDEQPCTMTLFHMRLQELRFREFSLRRYCRDSGREVCHSTRKRPSPAGPQRPSFQRSVSHVLQGMRPRSEHRSSTAPTLASLKRNDSGYGSMHSTDFEDDDRPSTAGEDSDFQNASSSKSVRLEFANYSQVEVRREGTGAKRRYEFEYWGVNYAWRRSIRGYDSWGKKICSFQLTARDRKDNGRVLARITPESMDDHRAAEERRRGGWIPPSTMRITDPSIIGSPNSRDSKKDVADAVVASGLVALLDDSIRNTFQSEKTTQFFIPKMNVGVEFMNPKQLVNHVFNRSGSYSNQHSRPSSSGGHSVTSNAGSSIRRPAMSRQQSSRDYW
jgi:hypothetical protein